MGSIVESAESPAVDQVDADVIEEARARQRRHRGIISAASFAAACVVPLVIAFGGNGGGSHPAPVARRARPPATAAPNLLVACLAGQRGKLTTSRAPDASLRSIIAALRRPPTPADAVSTAAVVSRFGPTSRVLGAQVLVQYLRFARSADGRPYYLMPERGTGCGTARVPARPETLIAWSPAGSGGAGGDAAAITQGRAVGTAGTFRHTTVTMIVPDGVATVTLHYPAGTVGGFNHHHAPAVTIAAPIVGNLLVLDVPRSGPRALAATMTWTSADGRVIKTFHRL